MIVDSLKDIADTTTGFVSVVAIGLDDIATGSHKPAGIGARAVGALCLGVANMLEVGAHSIRGVERIVPTDHSEAQKQRIEREIDRLRGLVVRLSGDFCGADVSSRIAVLAVCVVWLHKRVICPLWQLSIHHPDSVRRMALDVGEVIRLLHKGLALPRFVIPRGGLPAGLREQVRVRDTNRCAYCGIHGTDDIGPDGRAWHIDHIFPYSLGGGDELGNLCLSCSTCNVRKGASILPEAA